MKKIKPFHIILIVILFPFITIILCFLMACIALSSPFIVLYLLVNTYQENKIRKCKIEKKYNLIKSRQL